MSYVHSFDDERSDLADGAGSFPEHGGHCLGDSKGVCRATFSDRLPTHDE